MNFEERIKSTQPDGIHINCIGTAFYITEVIPEERSVSQIEANTLIDKLDILDEPELGCLTIFRKDEVIAHGAVVSKLSPLTVTYRGDEPDIESNYKVMDKSVDELLKEYGANSIEYRKAPNSPN